MSRKFLVNLIAVIVVCIVTGTAIIFAWYTNTKKTQSLDYVSNGLVLSYKIENETNVENYDIKDVVFFDVDSEKEGKYFTLSAVKLTLDITNYSLTPISVNLKQSLQPFTLSNEITGNVITIYKYTKANVSRDTEFTENKYFTFDNDTGYVAKTKYEAGNTYFERDVLAISTLTAENGKLKSVSSATKAAGNLITTVDKNGTSFVLGEYVEATDLNKVAFNAGVYYTLENGVYTQAKVYNSTTTYYEVSTMAYVGGLVIDGTNVTKANITTTGAFVSCVITDQNLDSKSTTGSVNSYFAANNLANEFTISTPLAASTAYNTAGGSKRVYLYLFGIQLFDDATSNFLENSRNVYPFQLIITANQA